MEVITSLRILRVEGLLASNWSPKIVGSGEVGTPYLTSFQFILMLQDTWEKKRMLTHSDCQYPPFLLKFPYRTWVSGASRMGRIG